METIQELKQKIKALESEVRSLEYDLDNYECDCPAHSRAEEVVINNRPELSLLLDKLLTAEPVYALGKPQQFQKGIVLYDDQINDLEKMTREFLTSI